VSVLLTEPSETATVTANGFTSSGPSPHVIDASYPGDSNFMPSTSGTDRRSMYRWPHLYSHCGGCIHHLSNVNADRCHSRRNHLLWLIARSIRPLWMSTTGPSRSRIRALLMLESYATETGVFQSAMDFGEATL